MPPIPMSVHLDAVFEREALEEAHWGAFCHRNYLELSERIRKRDAIQLGDIGKLDWFREMVVESNQRLRRKRWYITRKNDIIVEETPMINVDESDSGYDSEPPVVVTKALKAQSSKRKRNDDKEEEKEYEIYERTNNERAPIWQHFKLVRMKKDGLKRALCKFCNKTLAAHGASGTFGLHRHYPCPSNPIYVPKNQVQQQTHLEFKKILVVKLPFKFVEHEVFVEYTKACNGRFVLPSRHKLSRDVAKYYLDERNKLLAYLTKPTTTVHLTTDTWTSSCKKTNYMVVTAHFIDDEWNMHKRIINFRPIDSHKAEDISSDLLKCFVGWGIKNVLTMTVDNAPSNDKALDHLIKSLPNAKIYDEGKHFHIRCMAHILNLIVKEGLKEKNYHVDCVANARVPEHSDFGVCEGVVEFLEKFKAKTELISSSSKPLAHLFYREILDIDKHLRYWAMKPEFCFMVDDMVRKYNKYWGKFDELNDYMYFATILDPTMKQHLVSHGFRKMLEYNMSSESPLPNDSLNAMVREMLKEVVTRMGVLFQTYKTRFDTVVSKSSSKRTKNQQSCKSYVGDNAFLDDFLNLEDSDSIEMDTELTKYLNEPRIRFTSDFDILEWWKLNAPRFPIIARMAKDILAIQITTVASESAFSTGGRVLDPYSTNLSYAVVEALICTQDWVSKSKKAIIDDIDDLLKDGDVAKVFNRRDMENFKRQALVVWWARGGEAEVSDSMIILEEELKLKSAATDHEVVAKQEAASRFNLT
ncbi:zinc finger BED domain-containing protein RICESLEEPER 2 [Tanacetum coccineum]|uniref:Zinc finger BED domain-containing protein RICESLEEPER 2 n=1 Tax=Tanacetum coccineum TaxID=301880 RepID=A0ABQ5FVP5_9ASTR